MVKFGITCHKSLICYSLLAEKNTLFLNALSCFQASPFDLGTDSCFSENFKIELDVNIIQYISWTFC